MNEHINSNGTCKYCNTKSIMYGIENGNFTYKCLKCNKHLEKEDIKVLDNYIFNDGTFSLKSNNLINKGL